MVASIMDNASKPDRVKVFVGLDDDDPTLDQVQNILGAELVIRPAELTVAKMIDNLSLEAEAWADATIRMDDDFILETRGWDDNAECMQGLGYWRPDDPTHSEGFMSFVALSSEMARWLRAKQGFVHPPWFPFWFTDTWNEEIGNIASMKAPLAVRMTQPEGRGKTHGLRDIAFWTDFFNGFRLSRAQVAAQLIRDAYPEGNIKATAFAKIPERIQICALLVEKLERPDFIAKFEGLAEDGKGTASERYLKAKAVAEQMISKAKARKAA